MKSIKEITVSTKELSELFEVSEGYISQLVNDLGMPKIKQNEFNLYSCIQWRLNHQKKIFENEKNKILQMGNKSRLEAAQAEIKELELAKLKGELAPVHEFEIALRNEAQLFIKGLDALVTRLPFELMHVTDQAEMQKVIKNECDSIRTTISKVPPEMPAEYVEF